MNGGSLLATIFQPQLDVQPNDYFDAYEHDKVATRTFQQLATKQLVLKDQAMMEASLWDEPGKRGDPCIHTLW